MAKTVRRMVVDHPGGLHVRVDDGRPDEVEAAAFQVPGNFIGQGGFRRYLGALLPGVLYGFAVDEVPDVVIERAEFLPDPDKCPGVSDGGTDLEFVPDDGGVFQQAAYPALVIFRHFGEIEIIKRQSVGRPFFQHRNPAQPGLRAFQHQEFKQLPVVMQRYAPLLVVIAPVAYVIPQGPAATDRFGIHGFSPMTTLTEAYVDTQ